MEVNGTMDSRAVAKWKEAGKAGFQVLPDLLLKKQSELGLSATDVVVLLNLTMHWWYAEQRPFPRSTTIAKRMGVDIRTVPRCMRNLIDLGLVKKVTETPPNGAERQVCDLSGLVRRLTAMALDDPDYAARNRKVAVAHEA
jgi:DNA replication protein DnaD